MRPSPLLWRRCCKRKEQITEARYCCTFSWSCLLTWSLSHSFPCEFCTLPGKVITPGVTPAASAPAPTPSGTPSSASAWSAALRFAPRKSGSSSSAGGKAKAKSRPSAASLAFASSAAVPDADDGQEDKEQAPTPLQKPAPTQVRNVHGNATSSRSSALPSSSAAKSVEPFSRTSEPTVVTSTLVAPSTSTSVSKYVLPVITAPPELRLDQEELDKDRHLARQGAIARGEVRQPLQQRTWGGDYDEYDEEGGDSYNQEGWSKGPQAEDDEDVNGFRQSEAGAKANKKRVGLSVAHALCTSLIPLRSSKRRNTSASVAILPADLRRSTGCRLRSPGTE